MKTRLFSVYFGSDEQWARLARVLGYTARAHNPGWDVDVRKIDPPNPQLRSHSGDESAVANSWKLQHWYEAVRSAPEDQRLLLLDADAFVVGPLDGLWSGPFDVAYTAREGGNRFPLNAGVIAVRCGDKATKFFRQWLAHDREMLADKAAHTPWRLKYGGMNQASLGCLLETGGHCAKVESLPCAVWNVEDSEWNRFDPERARIVHVKSGLRMHVFDRGRFPSTWSLASRWKREEQAALAALHGASDGL